MDHPSLMGGGDEEDFILNYDNESYYYNDNNTGNYSGNFSFGGNGSVLIGPERVPVFTYVVEGLALTIVSCVGCCGNVISVFGLAKKGSLAGGNVYFRSFTKLLIALAICDLVYLLMGIGIFGMPLLWDWYKKEVYVYILPVCYGLAHTSRVGSVFLTVSVTVERYHSVCHPMRQFRAKRWLLPAAIAFAAVYNVPKFFELETVVVVEAEESKIYNETIYSSSAAINTTSLRRNPSYIIGYLFWSKFLLVELLPYIVLIVLNVLIWTRVRHLVRMRSEYGFEAGPVHEEELDLAGILISVVTIFIFCQSFKVIPDVYEVLTCSHEDMRKTNCRSNWTVEYIIDLSHFFLAFNSSVNFFIYVAKGGRFREVILQMFRNMGPANYPEGQANNHSSYHNHNGGGGFGRTYEMVVQTTTRAGGTAVDNHLHLCSKDEDGDTGNGDSLAPCRGSGARSSKSNNSGVGNNSLSFHSNNDGPEDLPELHRRWPFTMYDMPVVIVENANANAECCCCETNNSGSVAAGGGESSCGEDCSKVSATKKRKKARRLI